MGTWVGGDGGVGVGSVVAGGRVGYRGLVGAEVDAVDAADAMETRVWGWAWREGRRRMFVYTWTTCRIYCLQISVCTFMWLWVRSCCVSCW